MAEPLTADDLLPLVSRLSAQERLRLFRLITPPASDGATYEATPPHREEFGAEDEPLAWDAEGWEEFQ
jgi:hypothetical protein